MAKIALATNKYGEAEATPLTKMFHERIRALVQKRLDESGGDWNSFVFDKSYDLVTEADMVAIEKEVLATGYRYEVSATISATEEPDKYKPLAGQDQIEFSGDVVDGKVQVGFGDNVVKYPQNLVGTARYVHSSEDVMDLMMNGVPEGTIAVIDDSGGTLTAPVLEGFAGVVCMGGTVRSHLGILTREYGIPCLMNCKIQGIKNGDRLEMNVSAPAKTAQDYQKNIEKTAEIWKLV